MHRARKTAGRSEAGRAAGSTCVINSADGSVTFLTQNCSTPAQNPCCRHLRKCSVFNTSIAVLRLVGTKCSSKPSRPTVPRSRPPGPASTTRRILGTRRFSCKSSRVGGEGRIGSLFFSASVAFGNRFTAPLGLAPTLRTSTTSLQSFTRVTKRPGTRQLY